jgi:integrase
MALALFCLYNDLSFPGIHIYTLLSFMEFLLDSGLSIPTVKNYISSVKSSFKASNISIQVFESPQLALAMSSLSKSWRPEVSAKPVLSPQQFSMLILQCARLPLHKFYINAYLLGFMALLRISNVASPSRAGFDPFRHLRRGDVTVVNGNLIVHLRWTKTLQRHRQSARIKLFPVPGSHLCPVQAFLSLQRAFPVKPEDPFLSYRVAGQLFLITQSHLRRALKKLVSALHFDSRISFHVFRRSGASLAFASGIQFSAIQAHGTWASDALWAYIDSDARDTTVPRFFATVFSKF